MLISKSKQMIFVVHFVSFIALVLVLIGSAGGM